MVLDPIIDISRFKAVYCSVSAFSETSAIMTYVNTTDNTCSAKLLKIDGLAISVSNEAALMTGGSNYSTVRVLDQNKAIAAYSDTANGGYGTAQTVSKI